jgi:adenine-specific DNA-methyltransferase
VYADRVGQWYVSTVSVEHRRKFGQYLTPVVVADLMASFVSPRTGVVRILDPGAGSGSLACAIAERLAAQEKRPSHIAIEAFETDPEFVVALNNSFAHLRSHLSERNISTDFSIFNEDFILRFAWALSAGRGLFDRARSLPEFDICICNPPYFKLSKADPRARAAAAAVHGQPNIYALFMAVAATLLSRDGELVFITPRSFASGPYFRVFRERFFRMVTPDRMHVFESRREAFKRDRVLQENIIIKARRSSQGASADRHEMVRISTSRGAADLGAAQSLLAPLKSVLDLATKDKILRVPTGLHHEHIVKVMTTWRDVPATHGWEVSTGPVVPFRSVEFISDRDGGSHRYAPLIWMQNVRAMRVTWPLSGIRKPQYLRISEASAPLLVPDANYVLVRRFSAKEEMRRIVAAPIIAGALGSRLVGLENHLNYVHKPGGTLCVDEAWGLAVLFNSALYDGFFRTINGSTQVSATELRSMHLPPLQAITEIGKMARKLSKPEEEIEDLFQRVLL